MKRLGMEAFPSPSTNANATTITGDGLGVDDFMDFSFKDGFLDMVTGNNYHHPFPSLVAESNMFVDSTFSTLTSNDFWKPNEDIMDLEWISKFVEESFSEVPFQYSSDTKSIAKMNNGTPLASNNITFNNQSCRPRSKRPRVSVPPTHITFFSQTSTSNSTSSSETSGGGSVRKCSHCASEKTPQWRTGPLGPKTLCNACGVRYKSGRLVPEYRPAASPTFVLTKHSNSHRKVMELRRQKELHFNHHLHNHHHPQFSTSTAPTTMSNANTHSNFLLC